jgi:cell wall-associated NlpC family hydrolase
MASVTGAALTHVGVKYLWAGWLPSTGWDCSGFVGYVLGHDLGIVLPLGFEWTSKFHGPPAASYNVWSGAVTTTTPQAGDLAVWLTHIGIVTGSNEMVSALDPAYGTSVTPIAGYGPKGEPLTYKRITTGVQLTSADSSSAGSSAGGCVPAVMMAPVLIPLALLRKRRHATHRI